MRARAHLSAVFTLVFCGLCGARSASAAHLSYGWQAVDGVNIFFREGGSPSAPSVVFLHGSPASSIMYEKLMEDLTESRSIHAVALDYPSFGYSDAPDPRTYRYTFDNIAATVSKFLALRHIERYVLYMQDYGVPIGFRLLAANPTAVSALIVQNGVIHLDGFPAAQNPDGALRRYWTKRDPGADKRWADEARAAGFPSAATWKADASLSPDITLLETQSEHRPGVTDARTDLWFDYGANLTHYPQWQQALRRTDVPVLIIWGDRDDFFTTPGALAYLRDAPHAELHILDAGHFATLQKPAEINGLMQAFLRSHHLAQ